MGLLLVGCASVEPPVVSMHGGDPALLPGYMAMGETGMEEHSRHAAHMQGPSNTLPMMGGDGPFGSIGMGGMFTVVKVRQRLDEDSAASWYENPPGTVSESVESWGATPPRPGDSGSASRHPHPPDKGGEGVPR